MHDFNSLAYRTNILSFCTCNQKQQTKTCVEKLSWRDVIHRPPGHVRGGRLATSLPRPFLKRPVALCRGGSTFLEQLLISASSCVREYQKEQRSVLVAIIPAWRRGASGLEYQCPCWRHVSGYSPYAVSPTPCPLLLMQSGSA